MKSSKVRKVKVSITMDSMLLARVVRAAAVDNRSVSAWVNAALWEAVGAGASAMDDADCAKGAM